jgi:hypothetical protein
MAARQPAANWRAMPPATILTPALLFSAVAAFTSPLVDLLHRPLAALQ